MEKQLKNSIWMVTSILLLLGLSTWNVATCQTEEEYRIKFDSANAAYARGDFKLAQVGYEAILNDRVHFDAEFNLGNTMFKQQQLGLAILHYERAKQLIPNNEDLKTNLILVNSQISDRIESLPTQGIANIWEGIVAPGKHLLWHRLMIVFWTLGFIALASRLMSSDFGNRRIWGTVGTTLLALGIGFMSLSWAAINRIEKEQSAIVLSNESPVRSQPGLDGMTLFMLHEGTKVGVIQKEERYTEIKLPNGNVGWIDSNDMEAI
jgi:tetratricopeptide (TPR) repeat protein